uniref:Uncharacterized protein n=1 Tax=Molossus molossus TaxID=27622 RepID=A0A7J8JXQ7_MOLMO|nr:hypothetical protein HJG59_007929 [Molossus molossus]
MKTTLPPQGHWAFGKLVDADLPVEGLVGEALRGRNCTSRERQSWKQACAGGGWVWRCAPRETASTTWSGRGGIGAVASPRVDVGESLVGESLNGSKMRFLLPPGFLTSCVRVVPAPPPRKESVGMCA